jgi:hypothetical protein
VTGFELHSLDSKRGQWDRGFGLLRYLEAFGRVITTV